MIVTFYSFKGGVGRTLALANIAVVFSQGGYRVLAVDFDIEAPGLTRYLEGQFGGELQQKAGLLELLNEQQRSSDGAAAWQPYTVKIARHGEGSLDLITSGKQDDSYPQRVLSFNWQEFFAENNGGPFFEQLRDDWAHKYDYVLIDSRTGITDSGGVCTIQLPDIIVGVFTASIQSVGGVIDVLRRAQRGRQLLAYDRPPAAIVPLPSKFDARTEYALSQRWMDEFAGRFEEFYRSWLPRNISVRHVLERTKLPYVAFFSFGERLPIIEESGSDPESLGYALRTVANLLERKLQDVAILISGSGGISEAEQNVHAWIEDAEMRTRAADNEDQRKILNILARLVRITVEKSEVAFLAGEIESRSLSSQELAAVEGLRVVDIQSDRVRWRDSSIVARWQRLRDHVAADKQFLMWAQNVREIARSRMDSYLRGPGLSESLEWLQRREDDLIEEERSLIVFSERVVRLQKNQPPRQGLLRALLVQGRAWRYLAPAGFVGGQFIYVSGMTSFTVTPSFPPLLRRIFCGASTDCC